MLNSYDRVTMYVTQILSRLSEFIEKTKKVRSKTPEQKDFLSLLTNIGRAYKFAQGFSQSMKVDFVVKLKEEHERGFVFI